MRCLQRRFIYRGYLQAVRSPVTFQFSAPFLDIGIYSLSSNNKRHSLSIYDSFVHLSQMAVADCPSKHRFWDDIQAMGPPSRDLHLECGHPTDLWAGENFHRREHPKCVLRQSRLRSAAVAACLSPAPSALPDLSSSLRAAPSSRWCDRSWFPQRESAQHCFCL